jgi:hypothetical protein
MITVNRGAAVVLALVLLALAAVAGLLAVVGMTALPDRLGAVTSWLNEQDLSRWRTLSAGVGVLLGLTGVALIVLQFRGHQHEGDVEFRAPTGERILLSSELMRQRITDDLRAIPSIVDADAVVRPQGAAATVTVSLVIDRDANVSTVLPAVSARLAETMEQGFGLPSREPPTIVLRISGRANAGRPLPAEVPNAEPV